MTETTARPLHPADPTPTGLHRLVIVGGIGVTQTVAWASTLYLVGILADPMSADLGISTTGIFAAFSAALVLSAVVAPRTGQIIDNGGGRAVLIISNLLFALGLCVLAAANGPVMLWGAWAILGIAMGLGLYDPAFAVAGYIFGDTARSAITGITLIAGFASTIGWPLTTWGEAELGWRYTCVAWAVAHILLALPLHLALLPRRRATSAVGKADQAATEKGGDNPALTLDRNMILLAIAFAALSVVSIGMAAHLPRVLEIAGATTAQAVAAAALLGPAQVAARVVEARFLARYHPMVGLNIATLSHPLAAALLLGGGTVMGGVAGLLAMPFTIIHGAGNGILTIARGTVPLALWGSDNYGYRLGLIGIPSRVAVAAGPLALGALIEWRGAEVLVWTASASALAFVALVFVKR